MPATQYKIWAIGAPVGEGATQSFHVGVAGIAKGSTVTLPYTVSNELISNLLARSIFLPTPPGFIIDHNNEAHYVSLNFNLAGQDLPPVDPVALVAAHPQLACGIVLFDMWIVNGDRHRKNIAFDTVSNKVEIFDHSHAFFQGGQNHLVAAVDQLGIGGHCLANRLPSLDGMVEWSERMRAIPEFYIREAIADAVDLGLPTNQQDFCTAFLLTRRERLLRLVRDNQAAFPLVPPANWDQWDADGVIQ